MSHAASEVLDRTEFDALFGSESDRAELEMETARVFDETDSTATPVAITFTIYFEC